MMSCMHVVQAHMHMCSIPEAACSCGVVIRAPGIAMAAAGAAEVGVAVVSLGFGNDYGKEFTSKREHPPIVDVS